MLNCNLLIFCRKFVCLLGVILFILPLVACSVHEPSPEASDSTVSQDLFYAIGILNVDGNEMADSQVSIYQNSADIPLLELLQMVGCEIQWFDASVAQIVCNDRVFKLNLAEMSIREQDETQEQDDTLNLLALPLAGRFRAHCSTESGVLMVDSTNCTWILHFMGIPTVTRIDHESTTVYIYLRKDAELKVNGILLDGVSVQITRDPTYGNLPLVKILEALNFHVEWLDEDRANLTSKDKTYVLDLSANSLVERGQSVNLLVPPPGTTQRCCQRLDNDIMVDPLTLKGTLSLIGIPCRIDIDYDANTVSVST